MLIIFTNQKIKIIGLVLSEYGEVEIYERRDLVYMDMTGAMWPSTLKGQRRVFGRGTETCMYTHSQ